MGAAGICDDDPVLSVDDLADQILDVLNYFRYVYSCLVVLLVNSVLELNFLVLSSFDNSRGCNFVLIGKLKSSGLEL